MELITEFLKQGVVGLVAAVFLWLYLQERKERKEYQSKYEASLETRIEDAGQSLQTIKEPMQSISQGIKLLTDKIVLGKKDA